MLIRYRPGKPPKSMTAIRKKIGISSIEAIKDQMVATETWKSRHKVAEMTLERSRRTYITRHGHSLQLPRETRINKSSIWPKLMQCWNRLPSNIKVCDNKLRAKKLIKNWVNPPQKAVSRKCDAKTSLVVEEI